MATIRPVTLPATSAAELAALRKRVYDLERSLKTATAIRVGIPYLFHHMADPLATETSDKFGVPMYGVLETFAAQLTNVASSGDTTVELLLNGVSVAAITIAAGDDFAAVDVGEELRIGSKLRTQVTAVGTDALGLVCVAVQIAAVT